MKQVPPQDPLPQRRSFWLRCWQIRGDKAAYSPGWRFSLEDPQSGEKHGFTDMQSMMAFLTNELSIKEHGHNDPWRMRAYTGPSRRS